MAHRVYIARKTKTCCARPNAACPWSMGRYACWEGCSCTKCRCPTTKQDCPLHDPVTEEQ